MVIVGNSNGAVVVVAEVVSLILLFHLDSSIEAYVETIVRGGASDEVSSGVAVAGADVGASVCTGQVASVI